MICVGDLFPTIQLVDHIVDEPTDKFANQFASREFFLFAEVDKPTIEPLASVRVERSDSSR